VHIRVWVSFHCRYDPPLLAFSANAAFSSHISGTKYAGVSFLASSVASYRKRITATFRLWWRNFGLKPTHLMHRGRSRSTLRLIFSSSLFKAAVRTSQSWGLVVVILSFFVQNTASSEVCLWRRKTASSLCRCHLLIL